MRSKIAQNIYNETPQEVKDKVREYGNKTVETNMKAHYQTTIEKYSDYQAHDPCWINLYHAIDNHKIRQAISDALNKYFKKHGPDANEDYAGCCGPLMKYSTCQKALAYAFKKCRVKDLDLVYCIDGGFSLESDSRDNDPCTGELLHTVPINVNSIIDEIDCLIEQDKLDRDDWVWLHFVVCGYGQRNSEVNAKLRQLTRKHR